MSLPRPLEQMKAEARRDNWHVTFVGSDVRQLISEIERLQAIVDKLPRTADGAPVAPGMDVYFCGMDDPRSMRTETIDSVAWTWKGVWLCWRDSPLKPGRMPSDCYSTREAAEAARKVSDDHG